MRQRLFFNLLAMAAALWLAPTSLQAQECLNSFPSWYVPFLSVYYVSDPNAVGDRLVVGKMTTAAFQRLPEVPLPTAPNQRFCRQIELAPDLVVDAYVPTPAERAGVFSSFAGHLIDPLERGCLGFSGGVIPFPRIPETFAWRIPPQSGNPAPSLAITMNKVCYLDGETVTVLNYTLSNPGPTDVAIELKVWQGFPNTDPISYDNEGSDGSLVLPAGSSDESGPFDLFPVTPDLTRGTYEFSSRALDWLTGKQMSVVRAWFIVQ